MTRNPIGPGLPEDLDPDSLPGGHAGPGADPRDPGAPVADGPLAGLGVDDAEDGVEGAPDAEGDGGPHLFAALGLAPSDDPDPAGLALGLGRDPGPGHAPEVEPIDGLSLARGGKGGGGSGGDGGDPALPTTYMSGGAAATSFNIRIDFSGEGWTAGLQQILRTAADHLSSIILGDVADVLFRGKIIDDIVIGASITAIDGAGGVLGQAGPTVYRTAGFLPAQGIMQFDSADVATYVAAGLFGDIVLHEMMHVLGFGTMWDLMGLVTEVGDELRFTGPMAKAAYVAEFGGDALSGVGVPVETDGGPGAAGGHWDEATFGNELMTGWINASNHLSTMSVAALEDMGYDTVLDDPADPGDLAGTPLLA